MPPVLLQVYKLKAYLWILYAVLALLALILLLDLLHFVCKRIRFFLRLRKTGAEVRGLHPFWLLFSRPRKADFLVRGKSGITYAVRFVENWRRGTEYAVPTADRWYYAHQILLPSPHGAAAPVHLGFKKKWFGMDFRWDLERQNIEAIPLWLCYPRPYRVVDRLYDPATEKQKTVRYELVTGSKVDGIRLVDGSTILGMLTRDTPEF